MIEPGPGFKISKDHRHHQHLQLSKTIIMASLKCATGHARTPIDSLCRVFGISTRSGSSTSSGASRWIPKQHGNGIAIRQLHLQSRSISSTARILLRRPNGVLTNHQRAFSTSRPHLIMKPTGRFKTMEQIKSRANLGVLKISYGQALFRGASSMFSSLTCIAI